MPLAQQRRTGLGAGDLRFWAVVIFGAALAFSSGPAYTLPFPRLPGLGEWKQIVPADLAFLLLLAVCLVPARPAFRLPSRGLCLAAAGLIVAIGVTALASGRPRAGVPDLLRLAYSLVLLVVVASLRLDTRHLRVFATVYTSVALAVAGATLVSWVLFRVAGIPSPLLWINTEPGWSLGSTARAQGGFAHPTTLVIFLHSAVFYVIVLLRGRSARPVRVLAWTTAAVIACVLLLTYSRAVFAIVLSLFLLSCLARHTRWWHVVRTVVLAEAAVAVVALAVASHIWNVFPLTARYDPQSQFLNVQLYAAKEERYLLYRAEFAMFTDSPLVGIGPGLFAENLKRYVTFPEYWDALKFYYTHHENLVQRWVVGPDPHSSWFGWLARSGLVGIAGFAGVFGWALRTLWRRARGHGEGADVARVGVAFLVGFLAVGFIAEVIHLKLLWLFLALTLAASDGSGAPAEGEFA